MKKLIIIVVVAIIAVVVAIVLSGDKKSVNSFYECIDAGGALQESFPERCVLDGKGFQNPDQMAPDPL